MVVIKYIRIILESESCNTTLLKSKYKIMELETITILPLINIQEINKGNMLLLHPP